MDENTKKQPVKIIADSTCDMPTEEARKLGVEVVPLKVFIDGTTYLDGVDITPQEFYQKLSHLKAIPTTSQPTPGEFAKVYEKAISEGYSVLSLHLSSKMSGTYNSAVLAAGEVNKATQGVIKVFDTQLVSAAAGFFIKKTAAMTQAGATLEEIETLLTKMRDEQAVRIITSVDTLDYLKKSGRLSGAKHLVGSFLQIKPVLHFKDGEAHLLEQVRTRSKLLKRLAELVERLQSEQARKQIEKLAIIHADDFEGANELAGLLSPVFPKNKVEFAWMGPVVGAHSGPKALGVAIEFATQ